MVSMRRSRPRWKCPIALQVLLEVYALKLAFLAEARLVPMNCNPGRKIITLPRYVCTCHNILIFELICACFCLVQCVNAWEG